MRKITYRSQLAIVESEDFLASIVIQLANIKLESFLKQGHRLGIDTQMLQL